MEGTVKHHRPAAPEPAHIKEILTQFMGEFTAHLKSEGLIIVRAKDVALDREVALDKLRKKLLAKTWLTYSEILKLDLLPLASKTGVAYWVKTGVIKQGEVTKDSRGVCRVLTSAVKRLADIK